MLTGKNWKEKSTGEKLARVSKAVDVATIVGGLIALGFAPVAAMLAIQTSLITYAGAEVYEQRKKRKKKK